ncbi:MAG: flagellar hook-length control protein FliK [Rhodoferax sp.]|nr:flagellar hook-length control protein FliK [Rhodoferax sp.]
MTTAIVNKPGVAHTHAGAPAAAHAKTRRGEAGGSPADSAASGFLAIMASLESLDASVESEEVAESVTAQDGAAMMPDAAPVNVAQTSSDSANDAAAAAMRSLRDFDATRQSRATAVVDHKPEHGLRPQANEVSTLDLARQQAKLQRALPDTVALDQAATQVPLSEVPQAASDAGLGGAILEPPLVEARAPNPAPGRRPEGADVPAKALSQKEALFEHLLPVARKPARAQSDTAAKQSASSAEALQKTDTQRLPELRKVQPDPNWITSASSTVASEDVAALANVLVRMDDAPRIRSIFRRDTAEGNPGAQVTSTGSQVPAGEAVPVQAPTTEMVVAEQVAFWISRDVKNAEMTLDGLGTEPVQVSISTSGNEAQVVFRTDELQARELLENASAHLKDLLQREGLVLSGMSVGTNASGESGNRERRPREGVRHLAVSEPQAPQTTQTTVRRPIGSVAGGSLDLFV